MTVSVRFAVTALVAVAVYAAVQTIAGDKNKRDEAKAIAEVDALLDEALLGGPEDGAEEPKPAPSKP